MRSAPYLADGVGFLDKGCWLLCQDRLQTHEVRMLFTKFIMGKKVVFGRHDTSASKKNVADETGDVKSSYSSAKQ